MDFLLECIGFPPDQPLDELVARVLAEGEPAAWRGDPRWHKRLCLGGGIELRLDRESDARHWNLLPHYQVTHRLRVAVDEIRALPDSPFDALLVGWAAPPVFPHEGEERASPRPLGQSGERPAEHPGRRHGGAYRLCAYISDARRLPRRLPPRHVLAVSVACFALDVDYVGPDSGVFDPRVLERECAASIEPLGSPEEPGGCAELSLRIREIRHLVNPLTGVPIGVIEAEAPERPLQLFVSRWQLEKDGLPPPRPGWRIEGTFMFSGRIAGGLPGPRAGVREGFG